MDRTENPFQSVPVALLEHILERADDLMPKKPGRWCVDDHVVRPGDTPGQWHVYECGEDDPPLATCYDGWNEECARYIASVDPELVGSLVREVLWWRTQSAIGHMTETPETSGKTGEK
jgi:hypothetical protein